MTVFCSTCRTFLHCTKPVSRGNLKACSNHENKVVSANYSFERDELENKLNTLELAVEEREAISKRFTYGNGDDFLKLNDDLTEAYTNTIAKINKEIYDEYGILPAKYGKKIPKEEILAKFDEGGF